MKCLLRDKFRSTIPPDDRAGAHRRPRKERRIRIWCAAASTGQNPIAGDLHQGDGGAARRLAHEVIGTDLSLEVLEKAKPDLQPVRGAARPPIAHLVKYFTQVGEMWPDRAGNSRHGLQYRPLNCCTASRASAPSDIVFCRQRADLLRSADQDRRVRALRV